MSEPIYFRTNEEYLNHKLAQYRDGHLHPIEVSQLIKYRPVRNNLPEHFEEVLEHACFIKYVSFEEVITVLMRMDDQPPKPLPVSEATLTLWLCCDEFGDGPLPFDDHALEAFYSGLSRMAIADLPEDEEDRRCRFCLETFDDAQPEHRPIKLPCGHYFGERPCLGRWLTTVQRRCPNCRYTINHLSMQGVTGLLRRDFLGLPPSLPPQRPLVFGLMDMFIE